MGKFFWRVSLVFFLQGFEATGTVFQRSYEKIREIIPQVAKGVPFYGTYGCFHPERDPLSAIQIKEESPWRALATGMGLAAAMPFTLIKEAVFLPYEIAVCRRTHRIRQELSHAQNAYRYIQGAYIRYARAHPSLESRISIENQTHDLLGEIAMSLASVGIPATIAPDLRPELERLRGQIWAYYFNGAGAATAHFEQFAEAILEPTWQKANLVQVLLQIDAENDVSLVPDRWISPIRGRLQSAFSPVEECTIQFPTRENMMISWDSAYIGQCENPIALCQTA